MKNRLIALSLVAGATIAWNAQALEMSAVGVRQDAAVFTNFNEFKSLLEASINGITKCAAQKKLYGPGKPGADGQGCLATGSLWGLNGTNAYYNGNVGIGTTAPSYPLQVNGSTSTIYGAYPNIYANGDNHTGGGVLVGDDGGFFDHNDGWITYNGSRGLKIGGNNGAASFGDALYATGNIVLNNNWTPAQELTMNANQIWKSVTTGDPNFYLQWSNPGGGVVVGGQGGATNNVSVYGRTYSRDGFQFGDGTIQTTAVTQINLYQQNECYWSPEKLGATYCSNGYYVAGMNIGIKNSNPYIKCWCCKN